jgi:uncharacterized protein
MNTIQTTPRSVLITGATGMVGRALCDQLKQAGFEVYALLRPEADSKHLIKDVIPLYMDLYNKKSTDVARLDAIGPLAGVIHLAGESIMGYWTSAKKQRLVDSRVRYTRALSELLCSLEHPPACVITASAVGIYGKENGDHVLDEQSPVGHDFLATLCQDWESASELLVNAGIRTAHARFGIILSGTGGALKTMLPAFNLGIAGKLGDGQQWMSWVTLHDVTRALQFMLEHADARGAFNVIAPEPVTNETFTATLANVLKRPAILPAPAFALKMGLGEVAESLLLASQRCTSARLQETGFVFHHPKLESALETLLNAKADFAGKVGT